VSIFCVDNIAKNQEIWKNNQITYQSKAGAVDANAEELILIGRLPEQCGRYPIQNIQILKFGGRTRLTLRYRRMFYALAVGQ
jgi:hypothetical protein